MTVSQVMLNHDENQPNLWVVKRHSARSPGNLSRVEFTGVRKHCVKFSVHQHRCVTKRGIPQHGNFDVILGMATAHALVKNHQLRGDVPNRLNLKVPCFPLLCFHISMFQELFLQRLITIVFSSWFCRSMV